MLISSYKIFEIISIHLKPDLLAQISPLNHIQRQLWYLLHRVKNFGNKAILFYCHKVLEMLTNCILTLGKRQKFLIYYPMTKSEQLFLAVTFAIFCHYDFEEVLFDKSFCKFWLWHREFGKPQNSCKCLVN